MIGVVVVEDHPVFRSGLVAALERSDDLCVLAAVGTVTDAHQALEEHRPEVVLLDLGLPDGSGLDVLATLQARRASSAVLVLTMNDEQAAVLEAVRAGARGYLLKGSSETEIAEAVRSTARGRVVLDEGVGDVVLMAASAAAVEPAAVLGLTPREADVLRLVGAGLSNAAVAARLGLSPKTVRNQVSTVISKLGVRTRSEAAARAQQAGLA